MIVTAVLLVWDDGTTLLNGSPLIDHAASVLRGSGVVVSVILARGTSAHDSLHAALPQLGAADVVVLHDVHRPLAPSALVDAVVSAVRDGAVAAVPVVEVTETVKEVDAAGRIVRTVPRESLLQVQYPQAVRASALLDRHRSCRPSDPLLPPGAVTVPGAPDAFAVTTAHDLDLAAAVLATRGDTP
ncbi:MAG TPA: 2-C-methyl-D-erythritol 4-phosphate cytidylyltransferase [Mycobacteriales bacterium]|nr:2-C-methyl-D-erythritol 4-phosphate cytidylyltransferase [Mycobacteriales bacterium]